MNMMYGKPFLTATNSGLGQVLQLCAPIDATFSNFPYQAIFVPVLYNITLISHPSHCLYSFVGDNKSIRLAIDGQVDDNIFKIKSINDDFEMIPQLSRMGSMVNIFTGNGIPAAGNFKLMSDKNTLTTLSFNFNRRESDLSYLNGNDLSKLFEKFNADFKILKTGNQPMNEIISKITSGEQLWKHFVWMALLCLFAEALLVRFFKNQ